MSTFTTSTAPLNRTHRYITVDGTFGPAWVTVRVEWQWNYDGTLRAIEGVSLDTVPGTYIEAGDRLGVTPENLVPLIVRVDPALVR